MKIDFSKYSNNLELKENGIWFSKSTQTISYPEDGNDLCLELEDFSFWFKHRNDCIIQLVKSFSPNENFFDVGGGNGFVSLGLQNAGVNVSLLEPGISGVLNAKKRNIENVVCATTQNCGLVNEFVENIGVFDVVELYLKEPVSVIIPVYKHSAHSLLILTFSSKTLINS